jgi:CubicO group peptidase (beta-lactamase class C family)
MADHLKAVETVSSLARELTERFELAGLAVSVVGGEETIYAGGFGVQSRETGSPITPDSMFRIASMTKPFVATAVLQLVEAGELQLDHPVAEYLPTFQVDNEPNPRITVRHLLQHASGLPRSYHEPEADDDRKRYLRRNAGVRLSAAPGDRFLYSNLGYDLLGEVVAAVSGHTFEDYLRNRILTPAGMPASMFPPAKIDPRLEASPHLNGPHPILAQVDPPHPANNPSKGLISSLRELSNWAMTNLSLGRFAGRRILDTSGIDELWGLSLGWFTGERHGCRTIQKGGSLTGYGSSLVLAPDHALGVVVLANSYPVPKDAIATALLDVMLGHVPELPKPLVLHELYPTLINEGLQAAIARHDTLRADRPDDYDFGGGQYYEIGWANLLTVLRRPKEAAKVIELGVALNPDSDAYHHLLALAYNEGGEPAKAIRSLERCLALTPEHQGAHDLLAELKQGEDQA